MIVLRTTIRGLQKVGGTVVYPVRYRTALLCEGGGAGKYATLGATEHSNYQASAVIFSRNILLYSFIHGCSKC